MKIHKAVDLKDSTVLSEAAAAMGRKGGTSRAKNLTAKRRKEIATTAASVRWGKAVTPK